MQNLENKWRRNLDMKQCKGYCSKLCCEDYVNFGKTPGRCLTCNKHCTVCEYWITSAESKCDCCHNLFKLRKNYNKDMIEQVIFDLCWPIINKKTMERELLIPVQQKLLLVPEITNT